MTIISCRRGKKDERGIVMILAIRYLSISTYAKQNQRKGTDQFFGSSFMGSLGCLAAWLGPHYSFLPAGNKDERSADRSIATPGSVAFPVPPPPFLFKVSGPSGLAVSPQLRRAVWAGGRDQREIALTHWWPLPHGPRAPLWCATQRFVTSS